MLLRSAPYEAYFFDDDPRNISDVQKECRTVRSILIPYQRVHPDDFRGGIGPNRYYDLLATLTQQEDVSRGFDEMDALVTWAKGRDRPVHKTVFFDWDQTLSMMEGIYALYPLQYNVTYREMAEYYTGGSKRLNHLNAMYTELTLSGVEVYILTNNPLCECRAIVRDFHRYGLPPVNDGLPSLTGGTLFQKIIHEVFPGLPVNHIVHTGVYSKYNRNKGHWIKEHFPGLNCV